MTTGRDWFRYRRRVSWTDVDPSTNYQFTAALRYVEEAEIAMLREAGLLDVLYPHLPRTFVEARFRTPARFDEELIVEIRPRRLGRSSIEFEFRLCQGERVCADGTVGAALIDEAGTPEPLPEMVRERLGGPLCTEGV